MWLPISASVLLVGVDCYNTISHLRYLGNLGNLGTQVSIENKNGGLYEVVNFLNSKSASKLMFNMVANDASVQDKLAKYSFWSRNDLELGTILCTGIEEGGIRVNVSYNTGGKRRDNMNIVIPFSAAVSDENELKNALLTLVLKYGKLKDTAVIVQLPFGEDHTLPENLQFNNVPHEKWVRKFLYEAATLAVLRAVDDPLLVDKSRLQIKVNFPEVNPAFDTFRLGSVLEMVRTISLALMQQESAKRVRICVQQSMGEGIFTGLPIALSSMRQALERMDWGTRLSPEQQFQPQDNVVPRKEALLRFGTVGADQVADDDDVVIVISPQNVQGGMITELLEQMVEAVKGRPLILFNPQLADRPSGNNLMQIRGRAERRAFADSFQDIFCIRLLYPSSGGYMYPIRGLLVKRSFHSPWVVYEKSDSAYWKDGASVGGGKPELYTPIAAFDPYTPPDPNELSDLFC